MGYGFLWEDRSIKVYDRTNDDYDEREVCVDVWSGVLARAPIVGAVWFPRVQGCHDFATCDYFYSFQTLQWILGTKYYMCGIWRKHCETH